MRQALSKSKFLTIILSIIVTLRSGHAFQTIFGQTIYLTYIPAFIAVLIILSNFKDLQIKNQNAFLILSVSIIACTAIVDMGKGLSFYINLIVSILAAYCISELYDVEKVIDLYLVIMTVCTAIALVGYYLSNNTDILTKLPTMVNQNDIEYKIGIIFNFFPGIPERNCGMFWEPGLFATNLIIAFVLETVTKKKKSILRLILFSLGIITANSSAGFALIFLCLALLLVHTGKKNNALKSIVSFILIIVVIIAFANLDTIIESTGLSENPYFQKLLTENIEDSSRNQAISHNLSIFASDPIFGAGYTTVTQNMDHIADTSTSTYLMSVFGIGGSLYTLFIVWKVLSLKGENLSSRIILLAITLVIINKEPHYQLLSTWIILFYFAKGATQNKDKVCDII